MKFILGNKFSKQIRIMNHKYLKRIQPVECVDHEFVEPVLEGISPVLYPLLSIELRKVKFR